jgi:hypothetical protein
MRPQEPHLSQALRALRGFVTISAAGVACFAAIQLLVFGFVHFTDVRWERYEPDVRERDLSVVHGSSMSPAEAEARAKLDAALQRAPVVPAEVALGRSHWDVVLGRISAVAVTGGVVSALLLGAMTLVGVAVAGGGNIPGVERMVTASFWAAALALVALPVRDLLGSVPFPGVFGSYEAMVMTSSAVNAGTGSPAGMHAVYAGLPALAIVMSLLIAVWFRQGVEQGIIITSISQIDEMVEGEMKRISQAGVGSNIGPRTVGILNRPVGDPAGSAPVPPAATIAPDEHEPPARPRPRSWVSANDRRIGEPHKGDPLKRPI